MVGPLFTINAINIARAAVRKAERGVPLEAAVEIKVSAHDSPKPGELYVRVSNPVGQVYEIDVPESVVQLCLKPEKPLDVSVVIDQLAAEIREAISKALGLESTVGLDMEEVGGGYVASAPSELKS